MGCFPSLWLLASALPAAAFSPVFGILAQPVETPNVTIILSSYVKWLESAGARVVPIRYGSPDCEIDFLLQRINGLLLPGGGAGTDPERGYGRFAHRAFLVAVGRNIPIWATCLGHEAVMRFTCHEAGEPSPVRRTPAEGANLPLHFLQASRLSGDMPSPVRRGLAEGNITMNIHNFGVPSRVFRSSRALSRNFHLVASSTDFDGEEFVALTQHKTLPIVTAQFHIEKNPYEFNEGAWDDEKDAADSAPHGEVGVRAAFWMAEWLVAQARREGAFLWKPGQLSEWVIWNWAPEFSQRANRTDWEQQYVFPMPGRAAACPSRELVV